MNKNTYPFSRRSFVKSGALLGGAVLMDGCSSLGPSGGGKNVPYAVENVVRPAALGDVKIGGRIAKKMGRFFYNRILSDKAKNLVYQETLDAFKNQLDDQSGAVGLWQGEFWGKLTISAVRVCEYRRDPELKAFIAKSVDALLKFQQPDGYIGTYKDRMFLTVTDLKKAKEVMGWDCNWCWNLWCRKYTLWGLLEAYGLLGDKKILAAAERFMTQYIDMLHANGVLLCDTGTFHGAPSMSILKPLLMLYRNTGDKKFSDFAREIVAYWNRPNDPIPNYLQNAFTHKPFADWYPDPPKWAKVYETLSCLDGLLEYYRVTGDKHVLEAVTLIRDEIIASDANLVGSVGFNDIFNHATAQNSVISEPCDVIHWMRLNYELFALTADAKYMDTFEDAFLNGFLAGVYRDGTWGARGVRSHGRHYTAKGQAGMQHNHCCVDNMPRGYMNMAQAIAAEKDGNLYVSLYSEASVKIGGLRAEISPGLIPDGKVAVKVFSPKPAKVFFRIPAWSRNTFVDGAKAGPGWFEARVEGEKTFALAFDMTPVVVDSKNPETHSTKKDWTVIRWCSGKEMPVEMYRQTPVATIKCGPILLARSKLIGSTDEEMFKAESIIGKHAVCRLSPAASDAVDYAWNAEIKTDAGTIRTKVCDYASGTDDPSYDNERFFSLYF